MTYIGSFANPERSNTRYHLFVAVYHWIAYYQVEGKDPDFTNPLVHIEEIPAYLRDEVAQALGKYGFDKTTGLKIKAGI